MLNVKTLKDYQGGGQVRDDLLAHPKLKVFPPAIGSLGNPEMIQHFNTENGASGIHTLIVGKLSKMVQSQSGPSHGDGDVNASGKPGETV